MRLIGYVRVSTEDQDLDAQREKVRSYCASHGHELVDLVDDHGESGGSADRPGLTRCLGSIDLGEADGLLIPKVDRLTRRIADADAIVTRHFAAPGPPWLLSATEHVDVKTASGRLLFYFLVLVSQWELEANHERTEVTLRHKKGQGERTGSVPYGSDLDESGPRNKWGRPTRLIPNHRELGVIRLMRGWEAAGISDRQIADELNKRSIPTKKGRGPWRHSSVAQILSRPDIPGDPPHAPE